MQYDSYREKVKKVAGVLGRMYAHRLLILIALVVLTLAATALVMTKGLLVVESDCPAEVTYGEKLGFRAGFVVAKPHYEYREQGGTDWTEQPPIFPGKYQVRAWGKTSSGARTYTGIHDFTIVPREITLTLTDTTVEYGESPRVKTENLARGDRLSCQVLYADYGSTTTAACADTSTLRITDKKGNDRMAGYVVRDAEWLTVHIKPRALTVTVRDASKVYDDTALSFDGYEISKGSLLSGDNLVAVFRDTMVDAGTKSNTPTLHVYNGRGIDVTGLYDIKVQSGKLTVETRPLIVETESASYKYAGHALDHPAYTVDPSTSLVSGHYLEITGAASILDCGSAENVLTFIVRNRRGVEETHNYSVFVKAGTITVTPREVTVHTQSGSLVYNGTDQSYPYATVENGVGDEYRVVDAATRREVGSTENRLSVEFYRGEKNITSNYIVKGYTYGTMTIEPRRVNVRMNDSTKHYDGTPLMAGQFMVNSSVGVDGLRSGLVKGHTLTLEGEGSVIFGTAENRYVRDTARIHDSDGTDVTHNYVITVTDGTLTVTPRPVTVSTDNAHKVYDGTPLSSSGWGIQSGTVLKGHSLFVVLAGASITDVGRIPNSVLYELTRVTDTKTGEDVTRYYDVRYDEGTLEITRRYITLQTGSAEWMYDGLTHTGDPTVTLVNGQLLSGHTLELASEETTIHNAGTVENAVTVRVMDDEWDVTHNYSITYDYGTLTVRKRPIFVRVGSLTVTYDGYPHTSTDLSLAADSLPLATPDHILCVKEGDALTYTHAGSYIHSPRMSVYDAATGKYVTANYDITGYEGIVIIKKRPIHIRINGEKVYDGTPLDSWWTEYLGATSLAVGHTLSATPESLPTNAGSMESLLNIEQVVIRDGNGRDVRNNYTLDWSKGTLTIHRRPISLMTATAEKVYDGYPLTDYTVTVAPHSLPLVEGHTPLLEVYGSGTEVGQYPNSGYAHTFGVVDGELDVSYNYELVEMIEGTLTVKYDTTVTVTTGSATKPFDGLPLTSGEYAVEITRGTLPEGYAVYVDVTGIITRPGSVENTATVTVRNENGDDLTALFTVDSRPGVLTVTDELPDHAVFGRVCSDVDRLLYLRMTSYGDYNGKGWNPAVSYTSTLTGGFSPNLLPSVPLKSLGFAEQQTLHFSDMSLFMLPYYTDISSSNPSVGSDTDYTNVPLDSYSVIYYPMGDITAMLEMFNRVPDYLKPFLLGGYSEQEMAYRAFAYSQYLTIDSETLAFMESVISAQGFDGSSASVIGDVAEYIRRAARYDLNYDPALDSESNVAVAFLRDYREGVCVHYATAATLLYRALGIPARYTTGFMMDVHAGEWTEIRSPGHAWVEVYVSGLGWVQVEVTGSADDPDAPDIPVAPPASQRPELVLIPAFRHKVYDGTNLYASDELVLTPDLEALLKRGYTYTVRVSGAQREIGDGVSVVGEFILYDPAGKEVTDSFRLVKESGLLRVTAPAAEVMLYPLIKTYDQDPAVWRDEDYAVLSLPDGVSLILTVSIPADKPGFVTLTELNRNMADYVSYRLMKDGIDVTADYPLVFTLPEGMEDFPVLTVKTRALELTAASETRSDEGVPLKNPAVYITKGSLAEGHTLVATAAGTQTGVGSCDNEVESVTILDENGNDVTDFYTITRVMGTLTLLAGDGYHTME